MIDVRAARPSDAPAVADAHLSAWRVGYRGVFPDSVLDGEDVAAARVEGWHRRLTDGPPQNGNVLNRILVPVVDGRVVGFGHVGDENVGGAPPSGRGEVYGFYLHPDAWGTGAAIALMRACESALAEHFDQAVLWTLRDTQRSRRFYEKAGWTCGVGDEVLEEPWEGVPVPGVDLSTIIVVQYRRSLR